MIRYLIVLLTLILFSLSGCNQSGSQPAAEESSDALEQIPAELPDAESPDLNLCTEPRPEICAQNYAPVCGVHEDGSQHTYSNGCMACTNPQVVGSLPGTCAE